MSILDPRHERVVPLQFEDGTSRIEILTRERPWPELEELLDELRPQALGMLMPLGSQLHWYAYREARKRNVMTALALPQNVMALTGLMEEIPVEVVVATEEAAVAFFDDLASMDMTERIKGLLVIGENLSFKAPHGTTRYSRFPYD